MFSSSQLFGNVFERRDKYCCGILGSHQHRVQSKKQMSLMMAKELKAKYCIVNPGYSLTCKCVKKYDNIMEGDQNDSNVE